MIVERNYDLPSSLVTNDKVRKARERGRELENSIDRFNIGAGLQILHKQTKNNRKPP